MQKRRLCRAGSSSRDKPSERLIYSFMVVLRTIKPLQYGAKKNLERVQGKSFCLWSGEQQLHNLETVLPKWCNKAVGSLVLFWERSFFFGWNFLNVFQDLLPLLLLGKAFFLGSRNYKQCRFKIWRIFVWIRHKGWGKHWSLRDEFGTFKHIKFKAH